MSDELLLKLAPAAPYVPLAVIYLVGAVVALRNRRAAPRAMWLLFVGLIALLMQYTLVIAALLIDLPPSDSASISAIASRLKAYVGLQYFLMIAGSVLVVIGALSQRTNRSVVRDA
jgi:hypothetical protein